MEVVPTTIEHEGANIAIRRNMTIGICVGVETTESPPKILISNNKAHICSRIVIQIVLSSCLECRIIRLQCRRVIVRYVPNSLFDLYRRTSPGD